MQAIVTLILSLIMTLFAPTGGFAVECGACGAHVHEWRFVASYSTGEPVPVCDECYNTYVENLQLETIELQRMEG